LATWIALLMRWTCRNGWEGGTGSNEATDAEWQSEVDRSNAQPLLNDQKRLTSEGR
jgi:hypothetical protein